MKIFSGFMKVLLSFIGFCNGFLVVSRVFMEFANNKGFIEFYRVL